MNLRFLIILILVCFVGFSGFKALNTALKIFISKNFSSPKDKPDHMLSASLTQEEWENLYRESTSEFLRSPDTVAVYLIDYASKETPPEQLYNEYSILDGPKEMERDAIVAWQNYLLYHNNYQLNRDVCWFSPNLGLRFYKGSETLDVVVSFSCHEIKLYHNGNFLDDNYIQKNILEMIPSVLSIFPDDRRLQELSKSKT